MKHDMMQIDEHTRIDDRAMKQEKMYALTKRQRQLIAILAQENNTGQDERWEQLDISDNSYRSMLQSLTAQ